MSRINNNVKWFVRIYLSIILYWGLFYLLIAFVGYYIQFGNYILYAVFAAVIVLVQYFLGPVNLEKFMRVRYVSSQEFPRQHAILNDLAVIAGVPKPRLGISELNIPNVFTFGKSKGDCRICVTERILSVLNDNELKAVLGHEFSHIKNNDMPVMTLVIIFPLFFYNFNIAIKSEGKHVRYGSSGLIFLVLRLFSIVLYYLGKMIVLFISRIREYKADWESIELGNPPHELANALYKLINASSNVEIDELIEFKGAQAFFVNDISNLFYDIDNLRKIGIINDDSINESRLSKFNYSSESIIYHGISTHPHIVKRIHKLSELFVI